MQERKGVLLCRTFGTEIRMGIGFPVMVLLLCQYGEGKMAGLCLLASCMHECGHLTALVAVGCRPKMVAFGGFGMQILLPPHLTTSYLHQAVVSLAGPLESGLAAAIGYVLGYPTAAGVHLLLCLFNLLPILPLDGGQAFFYLLCRYQTPDTAERVVWWSSVVMVFPLTATALYLFFKSGYNISLLVVCIYLLFLLFSKNND